MISATNAGSAVACREVLAAWHDLREGAREEGEAVYGLELAHHLVPFRSTKYEDLEDNTILKVNLRRGGAEWHWGVLPWGVVELILEAAKAEAAKAKEGKKD